MNTGYQVTAGMAAGSLAGVLTSRHATGQAPAAYRAVVFIRGTDGTLRARQVSDPLTTPAGTWRSLGGRLTTGIAAHSDAAGTFRVLR
jgi:hypothetical protein